MFTLTDRQTQLNRLDFKIKNITYNIYVCYILCGVRTSLNGKGILYTLRGITSIENYSRARTIVKYSSLGE